MISDYVIIMLMSFLAVVMVLWYFRKRRELIRFISDIIKELEEVLNLLIRFMNYLVI